MFKNIFYLVLILCLKLDFIQLENNIQARRLIDEFTDTGKRVAAWMEHQIGNPEELGDRFESDIDEYPDEISKNGIVGSQFQWPGAQIPYVISSQFKSSDLQNIRLAFDNFHKNTCIKFRPRTTKDKDYIDITNKKDGCYSNVGKLGGRQIVNLQAPSCTFRFGTVAHELMHAAGFYHEHSRFDRDDYISILTQNIKKGAERYFLKYDNKTTTTFGVPYDYGSILHYSRYAFSVNPGTKPTIVPKKPTNNVIVGQRDKLSPIDIRKLRSMYKCR